MRRIALAVCLSVPAALLYVSPAAACINDSETVRTESEFRKHYEFKSGFQGKTRPVGSPSTVDGWVPVAAALLGVGLLGGSAALVTFNVRRARRG